MSIYHSQRRTRHPGADRLREHDDRPLRPAGRQALTCACRPAGILEFINAISYEEFAIDLEIWAYIKRIATSPTTDADALALQVIASTPGDYLGEQHTLTHFRQETCAPTPAYEDWVKAGMPDVAEHAHALMQKTEQAQTVERKG